MAGELKRIEAEERKKQISNVNYQIDLKLNKTESYYKGVVTLCFDFCKNVSKELMIDFITHKIHAFTINDIECKDYKKIMNSNITQCDCENKSKNRREYLNTEKIRLTSS